jgi:S-adenosylmethionine hydrolase
MFQRSSGIVTFATDFGLADPYVAILKGAVLGRAPQAVLVDVTHAVPPQDVAAGAFVAWTLIGRFPAGTVHVVVVDPGVGTDRRLLAVAAHGCCWLGPDNGVLGAVMATATEREVRALDLQHLGLRPESRTFHGRDVLAPVAGWLANGRYGFGALGPRVDDPVGVADPCAGAPRVLHVDGYGNLVTNVRAVACGPGATLAVGGRVVPRRGTYGEAGPGELLVCTGSHGLLEIAVRDGSAAGVLKVGRNAPVAIVPA